MRQHLQFIQGPAEQVRRWDDAVRQYEKFEQLAKLSSAATLMPGLNSTLSAATAFDSLLALAQRSDSAHATLTRSFDHAQKLYEQASTAALMTSRITEGIRVADQAARVEAFSARLSQLSSSGAAVYDAFSRDAASMARASDWQLQAPSLLPYAASTTVALLGSSQLPPETATAKLAAALDETGARVEPMLSAVSGALVDPYRGAIAALAAGGPDWPRHVGASLRVLVDELLLALAPDDVLESFFPDPTSHMERGAFTRRARLMYIFRDVAHGSYARMVEEDIDMTLATFFPANASVHSLLPTLDKQQGRVFLRRVQGCLATILATRER